MGAIIKKNVVYSGGSGGGDNSRTISYQDYLNLSELEKRSGITYYVPDYPSGSGGGVSVYKETFISSTISTQYVDINVDLSQYQEMRLELANVSSGNKFILNSVTINTERFMHDCTNETSFLGCYAYTTSAICGRAYYKGNNVTSIYVNTDGFELRVYGIKSVPGGGSVETKVKSKYVVAQLTTSIYGYYYFDETTKIYRGETKIPIPDDATEVLGVMAGACYTVTGSANIHYPFECGYHNGEIVCTAYSPTSQTVEFGVTIIYT